MTVLKGILRRLAFASSMALFAFQACETESCNPFAPEEEQIPSIGDAGCDVDHVNDAWTGHPADHNRFHCYHACGLRQQGLTAEADFTCTRLHALTIGFRNQRANQVCFAACPEASYNAPDPRN